MYKEDTVYTEDMRPEVAEWCNEGGKYHIQSVEDGFVIVPNPEPTKEELAALKLAQATSMEARMAAMEDALAMLLGGAE